MRTIKLIGLVVLSILALVAASAIGRSYHPDLSASEEARDGTIM